MLSDPSYPEAMEANLAEALGRLHDAPREVLEDKVQTYQDLLNSSLQHRYSIIPIINTDFRTKNREYEERYGAMLIKEPSTHTYYEGLAAHIILDFKYKPLPRGID